MKEIEILVEVKDDIDTVKNKLKKFEYAGLNHTVDEYYYDPLRDDLKLDNNNQLANCLRLRSKNDNYYVTYKNDVFEGEKWLYSNEYETKIESIEMMKEVFERLGLKRFLEIDNNKEIYKTDKYEIALEDVKDLGIFLEVEYCTNEDVDVFKIKEEIQKFIDKLGINVSEELNMGKPEMYMHKHNINF